MLLLRVTNAGVIRPRINGDHCQLWCTWSHTIQTIALRFQGTPSFIEVWDTSHKQFRTAHLVNRRSRKQLQTMNELVPQTTRSEQLAQTSGPLAHLSTAFRQPLRGILSLNIHFWVYNLCISTAAKVNAYKIVTSSHGFILQSDWYRQKSITFPTNVTRLSLPPVLRTWDWGYCTVGITLLQPFS